MPASECPDGNTFAVTYVDDARIQACQALVVVRKKQRLGRRGARSLRRSSGIHVPYSDQRGEAANAAWISPTCEYACGKLPHITPEAGSTSSDRRPSGDFIPRTRSISARASSERPSRASASTSQNVQRVKATVGTPKPSFVR